MSAETALLEMETEWTHADYDTNVERLTQDTAFREGLLNAAQLRTDEDLATIMGRLNDDYTALQTDADYKKTTGLADATADKTKILSRAEEDKNAALADVNYSYDKTTGRASRDFGLAQTEYTQALREAGGSVATKAAVSGFTNTGAFATEKKHIDRSLGQVFARQQNAYTDTMEDATFRKTTGTAAINRQAGRMAEDANTQFDRYSRDLTYGHNQTLTQAALQRDRGLADSQLSATRELEDLQAQRTLLQTESGRGYEDLLTELSRYDESYDWRYAMAVFDFGMDIFNFGTSVAGLVKSVAGA